jgi:uncharacterized protein (UPF0147 family)
MEAHPKVNPPKVLRCAYCGNNTVHVCTYREDYEEVSDETIDGIPIWDDRWFAILKCTTCSKPSIYKDQWDEANKKWVAALAYPTPMSAPKEVPAKIREAFDEAISVLQRSPSLTAVGIRKCLEGICDDQNAQGHTLAQRINFLGSTGVIPRTLTSMMDASRAFGNIGAHFGESSLTADEVRVLIEFTLAIFEYIYVAPARIESVRNSLQKRRTS